MSEWRLGWTPVPLVHLDKFTIHPLKGDLINVQIDPSHHFVLIGATIIGVNDHSSWTFISLVWLRLFIAGNESFWFYIKAHQRIKLWVQIIKKRTIVSITRASWDMDGTSTRTLKSGCSHLRMTPIDYKRTVGRRIHWEGLYFILVISIAVALKRVTGWVTASSRRHLFELLEIFPFLLINFWQLLNEIDFKLPVFITSLRNCYIFLHLKSFK